MKKFRFRLERVLGHRQNVKNEKKRLLQIANLKLQQDLDQLELLERQAREAQLAEEGIMTVGEVLLAGNFAARLKYEIEQQRELIVKSREAVAAATAEYIESAKEAEAMATLKRKRVAEYRAYVEKEEGKYLDELATQKGNKLNRFREG